MISRLRAEVLLDMPYGVVLEPPLLKVSSSTLATSVLSSLSEDENIFTLRDVLNLTREEFLAGNPCGVDCLEALISAIKELGFEGEKCPLL